MRTIWLAVVPVVLVAGMPAQGQQSGNPKKLSRPTTKWAVERVQFTEDQPATQPAPSESGPGYTYPDYPQVPTPPAQAAPHFPPHSSAMPGPHALPVPDGPVHHAEGHHHGCGCHGDHLTGIHRFLAWFCWKPARGCQKYPCGPCCRVPLNCFFCGCHEGYTFCTVPPCKPCPKPDFWGKIYATGHRMFAMPTGHGCACGMP